MKNLLILLLLTAYCQLETQAQNDFELEPGQNMLMTGKGPGQDGAINPYYGQDCWAIVKNTGSSDFTIRIQRGKKLVELIPIAAGETKKVFLLKDHQLYLDSNEKEKIRTELSFKKLE